MGLADILAAMDDTAHEEEQLLLEEAHAEAERLIAAGKEDVAAMRERELRGAADAAAAFRARVRAASALQRTRMLAAVRDRFVERVFEAAKQALGSVRETASYPAGLSVLVEEALDHFPLAQPLTIRCDPRDVAVISAIVRGINRSVDIDGTLTCWGGVVVADTSGRVVVDNTLEGRIDRARDVLWPAVAAEQADCLLRAGSADAVPLP